MMEQVSFDPEQVLASLPTLPGVYRMLDDASNVLYVGKAVDLKRRVSSYFQKSNLSPRIQLMVRQIARIETTVTRSEAEALILENNLIKALTPKYNILFRDDKSYPYLMMTGQAYPQLAYYRGEPKRPHQYFGPYPNGYAVRESLQMLQKIFRLRTCEDSVFSHRSRPCLLYQIRRCSAPCVGYISEAAYRDDVAGAVSFLQGKQHQLIDALQQRMMEASQALEFEHAAQLRDQLQALSRIQEKQFVSSNVSQVDCDVIAMCRQQGVSCINLVVIRGGQHLGDKSFFPLNEDGDEDSDVIEAFVLQHYFTVAVPAALLVNSPLPAIVQEFLTARAGRKIAVATTAVGERRVWLDMAVKNASLAIRQRLNSQTTQRYRLSQLNERLELSGVARLECFDISHTQGEAMVAACVVYDQGSMQPTQYCRYNIAQARPGDDYAAMREVLTRRYSKMSMVEGKGPDLVLIDGGQGQVRVALEVWAELGLTIPIVGIAKGEKRQPGLETLILPHVEKTLQLPPDHPALHLLQEIRDEAHRFAVTGHRARRAKARTRSTLEDIPGVGVKRRQRLLARFGGLRGTFAASIDDLAQVEGISRSLAQKIYEALH